MRVCSKYFVWDLYIKDERYDALKKSISDTLKLLRPDLHRPGLFHARSVKMQPYNKKVT